MLLCILEHWFSIGCICVKWGTYFSRYFNLFCGVRQGGVLSPHLFAICIDSVYEKVAASDVGCRVKWACVSILMYADDILLLAPTVSALQRLLNVCQCELQYLDMAINAKKSVCTRFGRVINNRVVIYLLRMVMRLSGVRMLDILVFILCHLSHLRVLLFQTVIQYNF